MKLDVIHIGHFNSVSRRRTVNKFRPVVALLFLMPSLVSAVSHVAFGFEYNTLEVVLFRWPFLTLAFDSGVPMLIAFLSTIEGLCVLKKRGMTPELRRDGLKLSALIVTGFALGVLPGIIKAFLAALMIMAIIIILTYEAYHRLWRMPDVPAGSTVDAMSGKLRPWRRAT